MKKEFQLQLEGGNILLLLINHNHDKESKVEKRIIGQLKNKILHKRVFERNIHKNMESIGFNQAMIDRHTDFGYDMIDLQIIWNNGEKELLRIHPKHIINNGIKCLFNNFEPQYLITLSKLREGHK